MHFNHIYEMKIFSSFGRWRLAKGASNGRDDFSLPFHPLRNERSKSNAADAENMASVAAASPSFVLLLAGSRKTLSLVTSKPTLSPPPPPLRPSHYQRRRSGRSASRKSTHLWRTRAASGAETTIEKAQQVIPAASDDGSVSTVVSALLFFAFIGLSVLTIGVVSPFSGLLGLFDWGVLWLIILRERCDFAV